MMRISPNDLCPCTSGKKYKKCCRRYHNGVSIPTPTDLVRARYSGYALQLSDFVMETTHPDNADYDSNFDNWRVRVDAYCLRNVFNGLDILSADDDKVNYRAEIIAFARQKTIITEDCIFAKVDGEWKYLSGELDVQDSSIEEL